MFSTIRGRRSLLAGVLLAAAVSGCATSAASSPTAATRGAKVTLSLVAYSTPQAAYQDLIKAFQATAAGRGVAFTQSYGASGAQERAIEAGLPADVAALSLAPDIAKLVKAGLVDRSWNSGAQHGFVTDSVVVLVVRKGNPKHIRGWGDLVRTGVSLVTPNPFSSGGARWNILAAYGAQVRQGRTHAQALAYLRQLFAHVAVQDKSGRESLQTFLNGTGDVSISYENEAIQAQQDGKAIDYLIPDDTILIENPVAVVTTSRNPAQARAFVAFLHSRQAQEIFAAHGYRPVLAGTVDPKRFPTPAQLFRIGDLGGWPAVADTLFDPRSGAIADIERHVGVSVG